MTKSLIKNTFREIKNTKARFISIMAIIALGVGFLPE
jgi:putative ABC transport system permease protein